MARTRGGGRTRGGDRRAPPAVRGNIKRFPAPGWGTEANARAAAADLERALGARAAQAALDEWRAARGAVAKRRGGARRQRRRRGHRARAAGHEGEQKYGFGAARAGRADGAMEAARCSHANVAQDDGRGALASRQGPSNHDLGPGRGRCSARSADAGEQMPAARGARTCDEQGLGRERSISRRNGGGEPNSAVLRAPAGEEKGSGRRGCADACGGGGTLAAPVAPASTAAENCPGRSGGRRNDEHGPSSAARAAAKGKQDDGARPPAAVAEHMARGARGVAITQPPRKSPAARAARAGAATMHSQGADFWPQNNRHGNILPPSPGPLAGLASRIVRTFVTVGRSAAPTVAPAEPVPGMGGNAERGAAPGVAAEGIEAARARAAVAGAWGCGSQPPDGSPSVLARPPGVVPPRGTYDSDGRWVVESLALGDNTVDENGLAMAAGVFHASAQAKAGHEGYHPVEWDAQIFCNFRGGRLEFPTRCISTRRNGPVCIVPAGRELRRSRPEVIAGFVRAFLRHRPGLAVIVAGIAARDPVTWAEKEMRALHGQPMLTAATHDCVRAALVNAVFAVSDGDAAQRVQGLVDKDARLFTSLRPLSVLLDVAKESAIACRIVKDAKLQMAIQSADRDAAFTAIAARRRGVFLVRLREDSRVDHVVVADANNGVIIDSEEKRGLVLSADILKRCGGEDAKKLRVCEVRRVKGRDEK